MQHKEMVNRKLISILLILISFTYISYSQDSLSSRAFNIITRGLKANEMNFNDVWLPIDTTENNYHKLYLFDTLFSFPLHSVDIVKEHANFLLNLNGANFDKYFEKIFDQLEFRKYQPIYYENNLSTKEIDGELGFGTDTTLGNEGGQMFRMFISPVIQIKQLLSEDFLCKNGVRLSFLKDNYKMVLIGSQIGGLNIGFDSLQKISKDFFIYSQSANRSMIYSNGISLYKTLMKLAQIAKVNVDMLKNNIKTKVLETPYGKVALGGVGNDKYEGDFTAILDIGGDDNYSISNSGNGNNSNTKFIVDLSGNDTYSGADFSLGGTSFGINIMIDLEGNDTYNSDNFTLGTGIFGVGILQDLSGDDKYSGKIMAQGASAFGIGLLLDSSGNDVYDLKGFGQGLALSKGFAALVDNFGKDTYHTLYFVNPDSMPSISFAQGASAGYYPYASGGIGLLIDGRGNDQYTTGICSQGFGYWFGLGGLYDFNGNDDYISYQYSEGSSINNGIGLLLDNQGNDSYESESYSQAFAVENSFAMLLDDFGNDNFKVYNQPKNEPVATEPSLSFLVDAYGSSTFSNYLVIDSESIANKWDGISVENSKNDVSFYIKKGIAPVNLTHNIRETYGRFNLCMRDTSSIDFYNILPSINHDIYKTKFVYDINLFDFERKLISSNSKIDSIEFTKTINNMSSVELYWSVLDGRQNAEGIELLKNKLIENTTPFEFLSGKYGTESLFERRILSDILDGLLKKGSLPLKNSLIDSSESKNARVLLLCLKLMSENKIFDIVRPIAELSKNSSWRLRAESAESIGKLGANTQIDILFSLLEDSNPYVRASAVYSLGRLMPDDILNRIHLSFYDDFLYVREKALKGLTLNRQLPLLFILQSLSTDIPVTAKFKFASFVTTSKFSKKEMKVFQEKFYNLPVNIRKIVYNSIYNSGTNTWIKKLKELGKKEPDTDLQNMIDRILTTIKKKKK
ncbi:MAG: HEAT repeat domain-containing protein [Ignavibacteriae bacterium]|nr:HEAT repeat domain-containing protein [Ignavibacteriota bacterium]